jgi:aryl-alcohol dehydrogenase-like predicted oxidoreductase
VQVIYNIFDPTPQQNLFPLAQEKNVGVLARVPFDEGSLTGNITEDTVFDPREFRAFYFRGDRKKQVVEHVAALQEDMAAVNGSLAGGRAAIRYLPSGRFRRNPGNANGAKRREERSSFRQRTAGSGDPRVSQASCVV